MINNTIGTGLIIFIAIALLLVIAIIVFTIIANWKMFEKAGKPGWTAIVPIYNTVILFEIIGYKWYYIFLLCLNTVPVVGQVAFMLFTVHYSIKLAKSFNQHVGFGIGLALVQPIFVGIIAFSKDIKYIGPTVKGDIDFNDLF